MLRPYQEDIVNNARELIRGGSKSIVIQSPTGSGKTILIAYMIKSSTEKGLCSWFVVHRRELVKQSMKAFQNIGIKFGVVSSGFQEDKHKPVQICSIQTLKRRFNFMTKPNMICWDEAHHVAAGSWSSIYEKTNAVHIGLTATPERLDGKGLYKFFTHMINGPSVETLIEQGYLCNYKLFAPPSASLLNVKNRMGDYVRSELQSVIDKPRITGNAINHYKELCMGKRAVVFCVSVEHSKHVSAEFNANGIPSVHLDGETAMEIRDGMLQDFAEGKIKVLCNVELFGEGFDLPAMEAVILLRPTQSLGLYLQQVGRVLRPSPDKAHAVILDHAGNVERHGLPDDYRDWSLQGHAKKESKTKDTIRVKICPKCFAAQPLGSMSCKFCGTKYEVDARVVEVVDDKLVEIEAEKIRKQRIMERGSARTYDELVALGVRRGYKNPNGWAHKIMEVRQMKHGAAH